MVNRSVKETNSHKTHKNCQAFLRCERERINARKLTDMTNIECYANICIRIRLACTAPMMLNAKFLLNYSVICFQLVLPTRAVTYFLDIDTSFAIFSRVWCIVMLHVCVYICWTSRWCIPMKWVCLCKQFNYTSIEQCFFFALFAHQIEEHALERM